jgi:hypothetical protein
VWSAALLAGLLGAAFSLLLARSFPGNPPVPPPPPPSEARLFAEALIAELQAEKYDEFNALPLAGATSGSDEWRAEVRRSVQDSRKYCGAALGKAGGSAAGTLELMREVPSGPTITRLAFLERVPRGGVVWTIEVFRGPEGWSLLSLTIESVERVFRPYPGQPPKQP